jgi:hypothetical protein
MSFASLSMFLWLLIMLGGGTQAMASEPDSACIAGRKRIFFSTHPLLDSRTNTGFSDSLRSQLRAPLLEIGYCVESIESYRGRLDTALYGDNLVLHTLISEGPVPQYPMGNGTSTLLVAVLSVRDWHGNKLPEAVSHPLISLRFQKTEISSLPNIVVKKISENLRNQFVAQLLIQSRPAGAVIYSDVGLDGKTPVEWVVPLGVLKVSLTQPGYLTVTRDLDLNSPGAHSFEIPLIKRRFYHSKFIYPAMSFGVLALVATAFENHYYSQYRDLGIQDQREHPEKFGDTFQLAKSFERLSYSSMLLAATSLVVSFKF